MCKSEQKLYQDMLYGINARKNVLLSDIARGLQEKTKIIYTIDRLSNHLNNMDSEYENEFQNNYLKEALKHIDGEEEYVVVLNDDTDINHEQAKKWKICVW